MTIFVYDSLDTADVLRVVTFPSHAFIYSLSNKTLYATLHI